MGLQSAMTTALTGLQAAETTIDVIGNNVANSNTVGFKSSEVVFATQFLQTQSIGSAPSDTNGGTNPRQIGLGVKVSSITPDFSQGTVEISSNGLDLAIQGDGFLIVQGGQGQELYTRNGQLSLNSENQIVTSTGNKLLGFGVNDDYELQTAFATPIEIPLGGERVAQATTEAVFQGVLNPTVNAGTQQAITASEPLGDASVGFPTGIDELNPFDNDDVARRPAPSPAAGSSSNTGSATPIAPGTYNYRVTFLDIDGNESTASSGFNVTVGAADDTVTLTGLPLGTDEWAGGVRIYRNDGGSSAHYRVGELSAADVAANVTTFTDTLENASLVDPSRELETDTLDNGTYTYFVTYLNGNGDETRPSAALGPINVEDGDSSVRLDFSDLADPVNPQYTQMRVYRNLAGDTSGTYRRIATLDAPGQVGFIPSYVDRTPSADVQNAATLDLEGVSAQPGTLLTNVQIRNGNTYEQPFELGTLEFTGVVGGSDAATQELEITATTSVQELIDFMSDSLGLQQQSNVNGVPLPIGGGVISVTDGGLQISSNFGEQNAVDVPLTAFRLTPTDSVVSRTVPITFSETQSADGPGTTTEFLVYDSLGSPLTVRMTTVLESADSNSTTYRWLASSGDSQPTAPDLSTVVGNGIMVFDSSGNLVSSPSARISLSRELTAGESPLEIDLDLSQVTSLAETNSSGEPVSSFNMIRQNGFPPGVLTDFIITESGLIEGQFSNGTQRTLGQVLMARFSNNQGLQQIGNSLYSASVNSGDPFRGTPGEDGLGSITAGAVELSNTDIGQDLVEMILAQTQYQAGSRVISTAQELLDELLALNR